MSQYLTDFTFSVTMLIVLGTFELLGVNITLYKRHMIKAAEIKYLLTCFILEWLVDAVLKLRKDVCHYTEFWENATIIVLVIIIYYKWRVSNAIHAVSSCAHFKTFYQSKSFNYLYLLPVGLHVQTFHEFCARNWLNANCILLWKIITGSEYLHMRSISEDFPDNPSGRTRHNLRQPGLLEHPPHPWKPNNRRSTDLWECSL